MKYSGPIFLLFELFCSICTTYTYIFTSLGKFYDIFSCCVLPLSEAYSEPLTTEKTFVGLQDVFKTSSRHVLKTSSTWLQRNNFLSFKTSWRRLEDSLKTSCKTKIVTLTMSSRRLGDEQNFYWGYLYLINLYFIKFITNESKANPKCIT